LLVKDAGELSASEAAMGGHFCEGPRLLGVLSDAFDESADAVMRAAEHAWGDDALAGLDAANQLDHDGAREAGDFWLVERAGIFQLRDQLRQEALDAGGGAKCVPVRAGQQGDDSGRLVRREVKRWV